ncbi:hypothetical protein PG988_004559 [Apiospora saccharicola]
MDPEIKSFVIEQWAEYGAITLILCSRLAVRIRVQGFRRLEGDDYLSVLAFVIITVMSFAAQGVAENGHNRWVHRAPTPWVAFFTRSKKRVQSNRADRVPPNEASRLQIVIETPEVAESLAVGSKWFLVGWFTYPGFVKVGAAHAFWACRECLVSCFVVNASIFVAVFRSSFWRPNWNSYWSYFGSSGKGRRAGAVGDGAGGSGQVPAGHTELEDRKHGRNKYRHPHEMDTWLAHDRTIVDYEATSSTERIHLPQEGGHSSVDEHQKIHVKREIQIRHLSSDGDESQLREDRMP